MARKYVTYALHPHLCVVGSHELVERKQLKQKRWKQRKRQRRGTTESCHRSRRRRGTPASEEAWDSSGGPEEKEKVHDDGEGG